MNKFFLQLMLIGQILFTQAAFAKYPTSMSDRSHLLRKAVLAILSPNFSPVDKLNFDEANLCLKRELESIKTYPGKKHRLITSKLSFQVYALQFLKEYEMSEIFNEISSHLNIVILQQPSDLSYLNAWLELRQGLNEISENPLFRSQEAYTPFSRILEQANSVSGDIPTQLEKVAEQVLTPQRAREFKINQTALELAIGQWVKWASAPHPILKEEDYFLLTDIIPHLNSALEKRYELLINGFLLEEF